VPCAVCCVRCAVCCVRCAVCCVLRAACGVLAGQLRSFLSARLYSIFQSDGHPKVKRLQREADENRNIKPTNILFVGSIVILYLCVCSCRPDVGLAGLLTVILVGQLYAI
jgi:hypothetical protein